jgi:hypothetical protein
MENASCQASSSPSTRPRARRPIGLPRNGGWGDVVRRLRSGRRSGSPRPSRPARSPTSSAHDVPDPAPFVQRDPGDTADPALHLGHHRQAQGRAAHPLPALHERRGAHRRLRDGTGQPDHRGDAALPRVGPVRHPQRHHPGRWHRAAHVEVRHRSGAGHHPEARGHSHPRGPDDVPLAAATSRARRIRHLHAGVLRVGGCGHRCRDHRPGRADLRRADPRDVRPHRVRPGRDDQHAPRPQALQHRQGHPGRRHRDLGRAEEAAATGRDCRSARS